MVQQAAEETLTPQRARRTGAALIAAYLRLLRWSVGLVAAIVVGALTWLAAGEAAWLAVAAVAIGSLALAAYLSRYRNAHLRRLAMHGREHIGREPEIESRERPFLRHIAAVAFIDIMGSTLLSDSRSSDAELTMNRYLGMAREIVEGTGGTIEGVSGDGLIAVWGVDAPQEGDAETAVRVAMTLVDTLEQFGRLEGIPEVHVRAGVLSGEVTIASDAHGDIPDVGRGIAGEVVASVVQLAGAAKPGSILVGRSIVDVADRSVEFESAGVLKLKNIPETIEAFRPIRWVGRAHD